MTPLRLALLRLPRLLLQLLLVLEVEVATLEVICVTMELLLSTPGYPWETLHRGPSVGCEVSLVLLVDLKEELDVVVLVCQLWIEAAASLPTSAKDVPPTFSVPRPAAETDFRIAAAEHRFLHVEDLLH